MRKSSVLAFLLASMLPGRLPLFRKPTGPTLVGPEANFLCACTPGSLETPPTQTQNIEQSYYQSNINHTRNLASTKLNSEHYCRN